MKHKLLTLLLTALLGLTGMNAWAQDYEISSAQDLADFASAVNGGETTASAVLTDDIDMSELTSWTAIGDWNTGAVTSAYCGHFDGQGHTIKNFNFTSTHNYYGIFGVVSTGCLIENLIVKGTITTNIATAGVVGYARDATPTLRNIHSYLKINNTRAGSRLGGILGSSVNGTIVVDRCTYSGTMDGNDSGGSGNYGGIVGYVNNNGNAHLRVTNCLFNGELKNSAATPGNCTFGGMVGYVGASPDVTITNCLSLGKLQSAITGLFYGAVKHNTCSIINSYYQKQESTYTINGAASGAVTPTTQQVTEVDETKLMSGEICFWLNESVSGGTNWFQTLMDDDYPFPYNGGYHDPVYANGSFICDGVTPKEGSTVVYSNTNSSIVDEHNFANGFCTVCGAFDGTYMTANADGIFEIGTPAQLKWFAVYVNQVAPASNAVLTADIDLTGVDWTPIGNSSVAYTGTFDGQGKTISNFTYTATATHNGLFGSINGATIQNFCINGSLTSDKNYSGVIGYSAGASNIKRIHSSLDIDIQFKGWAGGVVGGATGAIVIEECWFDGTFDTHNFADAKGGILGYANSATIKNCLFSGTFTGEDKQHYGGILGYINDGTFGGVQNCLSMGSVTTTNVSHNGVAAIIGNINNSAKLTGITNNYWLTGSSYAGYGGSKAGSAEAPHEVTTEQLASGEVAYGLGAAWSQFIGTDTAPVIGTDAPVSYVGAAGYATMYDTTTGYELNGDARAYVATLNGNGYSQWLDLSEIENVPVSTPVVLGGTYYNKIAADLPAINVANVLKGTATDTEADGTMYVLAMPAGEKVGFYLATTGTIKAGKAYLQLPEESGIKAFYFGGEDDATSINEELRVKNEEFAPVYNLAGQRLQKMQKGINIMGGRKVLK